MAKKHEPPRILLRRAKAPLQLRGEVGSYLPSGAQYEYKPRSVFAQYRVLSVVFGVIALLLIGYWALAPGRAKHGTPAQMPASAPQDEPVFVQPIQRR